MTTPLSSSTAESTFNIAVLGAGQIAQAAHFPAVRKAKTANLYAICDAADDLRERMASSTSRPRRSPITTPCWPMSRSTR